jgi:hypothetical protein
MIEDGLKIKGDVQLLVNYKNGKQDVIEFPNTVLRNGRRAMTLVLANQIGSGLTFYISRMVFGDGGTQDGVKKYVNYDRSGLFGTTRLVKPVLASVDPTVLTQVIFTSVITFEEAIGITLNEMALQMANGELYSMTTFPDLGKTEEMQLVFNWRINFI